MTHRLLYKLDISGDGQRFMELHRELLHTQDSNIYIHVFTWAPTQVSVGYNQSISKEVLNEWRKRDITVVKRPTGGAAVLHVGDISLAVVIPREYLPRRTKEAYNQLTMLIRTAIKNITGISLKYTRATDYRASVQCFATSTGYELGVDEEKVIGIALRATRAKLLLHGSIRIAPHPHWFLDDKKEGWLEGLTPQATLTGLIDVFSEYYTLKTGGIFSVL